MKNFKYIISLLLLILILSCTDDLRSIRSNEDIRESFLQFSISMPEPQKVQTRAVEDDDYERTINNLVLLIFDKQEKLVLYETVDISKFIDGDQNYKNIFKLNYGNTKLSGNETVYTIANTDVNLENIQAIDDINKLTENSLTTDKKKFVMSGKLEKLSKTETNHINLYRTAAKVSVKDGSLGDLYEIWNTASEGLITSYLQLAIKAYTETTNQKTTDIDNNNAYIYPTEADHAFMIVKAKYPENTGEEYFYKIAFLDTDRNPLEIKPNHWYEVEIKDIKGKGYATPDEAAKHDPSNLLEVKIHDHAPEVYSMVSDGIRELGVKAPLIRDISTSTSEDDESKNYLYIRLFSADESEYSGIQATNIILIGEGNTDNEYDKLTIDYSSIKDWFGFYIDDAVSNDESIKFEKGDNEVNNYESDSDETTASKGVTLKFPVKFFSSNLSDLNSVEGELKVYWKGMERTVQVVWNRDFSADEISEVSLTIHKGSDSQTVKISDYWTFLAGNGTKETESGTSKENTPKLYGAGQRDMSPTKVRNQGFHFPVMYGEENNKWTYEYNIKLETEESSCSIKVDTDNQNFTNSIKINKQDPQNGEWDITFEDNKSFTLTSKYDSYEYCTGTLTVFLGEKSFEFDLYHTGFFHYQYNENDKRVGETESSTTGYYYYEVIKLDGSNDEYTYWLDRNLGATAAGLYIQGANGENIVSEHEWPYTSGAKGGYYKFSDVSCPPGYRVPEKAEWDNIRLSSKFINEERTSSKEGSSVSYFTSYFQPTGNEMVIFPKSRYYNVSQNSMMGDAFAGYYWTSTEDHSGWNKALFMIGSSNYYGLGDINNYGMSVRCVADIKNDYMGKISTENHTISFNVSGATHVYLYRYNSNGERTGLFSWPGKGIGNAMSMSTGGYSSMNENLRKKLINFSYTSTIAPFQNAEDESGNLYVIFNFVTDDGRIWTYSTSTGFGVLEKLQPYEVKGWKVIEGGNYLFQFDITGGNDNRGSGGYIEQYDYTHADVTNANGSTTSHTNTYQSSIYKNSAEIENMKDNHQ